MKAEPSANLAKLPADEGTPVSQKIRERILAARKRFHSNDNIAAFIEPGELEKLLRADNITRSTALLFATNAGNLQLQIADIPPDSGDAPDTIALR